MGIIVAVIFLFAAGLVFLVWPEQLRDWVLSTYKRAGFSRKVVMQDIMFTRGYVLAFRVAGAMSMIVGAALLVRSLT